jgi:hypothetical protein
MASGLVDTHVTEFLRSVAKDRPRAGSNNGVKFGSSRPRICTALEVSIGFRLLLNSRLGSIRIETA